MHNLAILHKKIPETRFRFREILIYNYRKLSDILDFLIARGTCLPGKRGYPPRPRQGLELHHHVRRYRVHLSDQVLPVLPWSTARTAPRAKRTTWREARPGPGPGTPGAGSGPRRVYGGEAGLSIFVNPGKNTSLPVKTYYFRLNAN